MKTIWKFPLKIVGQQVVEMPFDAEILTGQMQSAQLCLWAVVDSEAALERRTIFIAGTGHAIPSDMSLRYIATAQMDGGALIWHVFEQT